MTRFVRHEWSELYGREYNQEKVTYNDIYFQQKSLWPIFFRFFLPGSCHRNLGDLIIGLTNTHQEVTRNESQ